MVCRSLEKAGSSICCLFLCVVTVLTLAGLVAWLSLTPKNPCFRVYDIHVPSLGSGNFSSVPKDPIIVNLEVSNTNKRMGIYYSEIRLELYRGGSGVAGTNSTSGFYQENENNTVIQTAISASREFWQGVNSGNVDFVIRVKTGVKFRIIKWTTKMHEVEYEEKFSNVKIGLNGTTVLGLDYEELQDSSKVKTTN